MIGSPSFPRINQHLMSYKLTPFCSNCLLDPIFQQLIMFVPKFIMQYAVYVPCGINFISVYGWLLLHTYTYVHMCVSHCLPTSKVIGACPSRNSKFIKSFAIWLPKTWVPNERKWQLTESLPLPDGFRYRYIYRAYAHRYVFASWTNS